MTIEVHTIYIHIGHDDDERERALAEKFQQLLLEMRDRSMRLISWHMYATPPVIGVDLYVKEKIVAVFDYDQEYT